MALCGVDAQLQVEAEIKKGVRQICNCTFWVVFVHLGEISLLVGVVAGSGFVDVASGHVHVACNHGRGRGKMKSQKIAKKAALFTRKQEKDHPGKQGRKKEHPGREKRASRDQRAIERSAHTMTQN